MTNDEAMRMALQMARAIWKQMNFRGGDPTREWDSLTPDMQQPILDSCRVGLAAVQREIENAAFERADHEIAKWESRGHVRLHAGEMSAQEMRSVLAVVGAIRASVHRALIQPPAQPEGK